MGVRAGRTQERKRPRSESRQRPGQIGARLSEDELARVRAAAQRQGKSVSEYVRTLVTAAS